nr:zinc finger protein 674-like [Cherax quadricarinatus]
MKMDYYIQRYKPHNGRHDFVENNAADVQLQRVEQYSQDIATEIEVIEEESSDMVNDEEIMEEADMEEGVMEEVEEEEVEEEEEDKEEEEENKEEVVEEAVEEEEGNIPSNDPHTCKEEMPNAVEFLSVECDMILEPECDLETGNQASYRNGRHKMDKVQASAIQSDSDPVFPILYHIPFISKLFRYRDVDVYRRTCKDGPFVKIFIPESSFSNSLKRRSTRVKHANNKNNQEGDKCENGKNIYEYVENRRLTSEERGLKDQVNDSPSKCEVCQKQFMDKSALMVHKLSHIIVSGKSYPCTVCEATFTNKSLLRSHIKRHFCLKNVQCQFCDKKFQSNSQFIIHQRIHIGEKPFQCQYCEKSFTYKFQFDSHQRIHVGKSLLKCEYCDATFSQKQALIEHERKHTGEKPFKCEKCSATFRVRSYLGAHKKCHMDRKPRECPDCGSQFWKSSALKKHRKAEHDT